jgi:hypothetical protein
MTILLLRGGIFGIETLLGVKKLIFVFGKLN